LATCTAFLFLALSATSTQAADVSIGLGVGLSDDYVGVPIPFFNVAWSNHMSVNVLGNKAKVNLIPSAIWKGGLIGEYIGERDDVDNDAVDDLRDVDTSIMLDGGLFCDRCR
jgi:hypothetical protein